MLAGKIHDGGTVKITAGKDGLMFNRLLVRAFWPYPLSCDSEAFATGCYAFNCVMDEVHGYLGA